ncbi:MAG: DNA-binding protein [Clostridiales bacterium]|nr:DNA-binding protein [Clostridiales bacterium]
MEYRRFGNDIILRLDPGEEICASLLFLADKEDIMLAGISGLGAINSFTTGVFYTAEKQYHSNDFEGYFEISSLTGTLSRQEDRPYLHVHMSAGDVKGNVFGGHLNRAVVSATAEIVIHIIDGEVGRKYSDEVGLNLFEF